MIRAILVPLDGSIFGEHALPAVRTIARASGASVYLAHVHIPSVPHDVAREPHSDDGLDAEERMGEHAYLESIPARLSAEADLTFRPVLLDGPIADALAARVASSAIDLVVMTTHGRGGVSRLLLGSTAYRLVQHSTAPVLLIRPSTSALTLTAPRTFRHILIPLDGSQLAEQVLEPALELARLLHADCTLVQVLPPLPLIGYDEPAASGVNLDAQGYEELWHDAEQQLATVAQRVHAANVAVHTQISIDVHPAAGIIHAVGETGADLIALATHGRSGLDRALLGSVADSVVHRSEVPVLVYRPQATSDAGGT